MGGFPATQNGDVTTPPFFFSADYSQLVFVQYGKNYESAPANPDDQNDYIYAVLFQWNAGTPTAPICIRMRLSNLAIPSNVDTVDGTDIRSTGNIIREMGPGPRRRAIRPMS